MTSRDFPMVWLEVNLPKSPRYILGSAYREWGSEDEKSIDRQIERLSSLEEQLSKSSKGAGIVWIGGDWNLDASKFEDPSWRLKSVAAKFSEAYERAGMKLEKVGPTYTYRVGDDVRTSELDYFLTSCGDDENVIKSTISCGFSDHDCAMAELTVGNRKKSRIIDEFFFRRSSIKNKRKFEADMQQQMSTCLSIFKTLNDGERMAQELNDRVKAVIDENAPMRRIKKGHNHRSDISYETKSLMKERDAAKSLVKKMSVHERHIQLQKFKTLRN